jgi:hypothetical protein
MTIEGSIPSPAQNEFVFFIIVLLKVSKNTESVKIRYSNGKNG